MNRTEYEQGLDKAISKIFDEWTSEAIDKASFTKFFDVTDDNIWDKTYWSIEGISKMDWIADGQEPPKQDLWEWYSVLVTSASFWGSIDITRDARLQRKDNTVMFEKFANAQANHQVKESKDFLERDIHKVINDSFDWNEFVAPDTNPILWEHIWKSTGKTLGKPIIFLPQSPSATLSCPSWNKRNHSWTQSTRQRTWNPCTCAFTA